MQERINQECEREVIQVIKTSSDRYVMVGGSVQHPQVILNMRTKEYHILYGFGEERRAYSSALDKQGFKANPRLYPKAEQSECTVAGYNPKFDMSLIGKCQGVSNTQTSVEIALKNRM